MFQECREFRASTLKDMRSNGHDWGNCQSCFLWLRKWGAHQKRLRHLRGQMSKYNFCGLVPNSTFSIATRTLCFNPKCWATRYYLVATANSFHIRFNEECYEHFQNCASCLEWAIKNIRPLQPSKTTPSALKNIKPHIGYL